MRVVSSKHAMAYQIIMYNGKYGSHRLVILGSAARPRETLTQRETNAEFGWV